MTLTDPEDSPPLIAPTMLPPSPESREAPTNPENLRPDPYDTSFISSLDAEFAQAVRIVASVGNDIARDRDERRVMANRSAENQRVLIEQQNEIIGILQRTELSTEANYRLMLDAVRRLEASDNSQNARLVHHESRIDGLHAEIRHVKQEILDAIPPAIQAAVAPYVDRLEELERLTRDLANEPPEAPTPQ